MFRDNDDLDEGEELGVLKDVHQDSQNARDM